MKQISFDGRIGKSGAEVRTTKGGKQYVKFSVANNSFSNGTEKVEWFDVTSYDPYVIENRVKYLTKGTYVIVSGSINTEVSVKEGKVWLNQYVTASCIDTPSFKKKDEEGSDIITSQTSGVSHPTIPSYATVSSSPAASASPSIPTMSPTAQPVDNFVDPLDDDMPF